MQVDTYVVNAVISSKILIELGEPQLDDKEEILKPMTVIKESYRDQILVTSCGTEAGKLKSN